jgi:hypothetical protein
MWDRRERSRAYSLYRSCAKIERPLVADRMQPTPGRSRVSERQQVRTANSASRQVRDLYGVAGNIGDCGMTEVRAGRAPRFGDLPLSRTRPGGRNIVKNS